MAHVLFSCQGKNVIRSTVPKGPFCNKDYLSIPVIYYRYNYNDFSPGEDVKWALLLLAHISPSDVYGLFSERRTLSNSRE